MDLIVRHHGQYVGRQQDRLARLSGRDGHVIWDVALADGPGWSRLESAELPHAFGDVDGDGQLAMFVLVPLQRMSSTPCERRVISLRDGKTLWSHTTPYRENVLATFAAADLDGDGRPELVVRDQLLANAQAQFEVTALDGRVGSTRWTWRRRALQRDQRRIRTTCAWPISGARERAKCASSIRISATQQRVVILDAMGQERAGREVKAISPCVLLRADLEGDGADELLFRDGDRLCAVGRDLKDRWCWPSRDAVGKSIPARAGQPAVVVLNSMVGIDGATGRPRWDGQWRNCRPRSRRPRATAAACARRIGRCHGLPARPGHESSGAIHGVGRRASRTT